jgi:tetratricopeptide (TPR) repeat protein
MLLLKYNKILLTLLLCLLFPLKYSPLNAQEVSALDYYKQAQKLANDYQYFEATTILRRALALNPYFFNAKLLLGDCYFMLKNYSTAWDIYIDAQSAEPDNVALLNKLAKTKIAMAQTPDETLAALFYLKKAYSLAPRDPDVVATFGSYYYDLGEYQKAMEYYQKLGEKSNNVEIYLNKAKVYEKWGDSANWFKELKNAETITSNNYQVALELGNYFYAEKNYDSALEYYNLAQSLNPDDVEGLLRLVKLYIEQKNFEKAIPEISRLIEKDKSNAEFYYLLGVCYEALGQFDRAIDVLTEGLKFDFGNEFLRTKAEEIAVHHLPINSITRKQLASYYESILPQGPISTLKDNTVNLLKRSLRVNPLSLNTRLMLANLYRQNGFLYEYLRILQSGLFIDPNNQKLKDDYRLNQKFKNMTLEFKEQVPPFSLVKLKPIYMVGDVINDGASYPFFSQELRELVLESLNNTKRLNAFLKNGSEKNKIPNFEIRFLIHTQKNKLNLKVDIIFIKTGAVYKSYNITEYGNSKLFNAISTLRDSMLKESSVIGKITRIRGNEAIINIGASQGLKKGDQILILGDDNLSAGVLYQNKDSLLSVPSSIATGTVTHIGENIAKMTFKPLGSIIFNMVQENQDILFMKNNKKGK